MKHWLRAKWERLKLAAEGWREMGGFRLFGRCLLAGWFMWAALLITAMDMGFTLVHFLLLLSLIDTAAKEMLVRSYKSLVSNTTDLLNEESDRMGELLTTIDKHYDESLN